MVRRCALFHHVVAAFATAIFALAADAGPVDDALFAALANPEGDAWIEAESRILTAWEDTGSEALNMIQTRGEAALDLGDYPAAIDHLSALIDHAPDHARAYQLRAMAFYLADDFGRAGADLARALTLEPRQYLALTQLGGMLDEMGKTEAAARALQQSLKINPHQQDAADALAALDRRAHGTDI